MFFKNNHHPSRQRGNVFAVLFGAVAITGVLAAVSMQSITGPIRTASNVTQKNKLENQMQTNAKILIMNAITLTENGDADDDGFVEPIEYVPSSNPACDVSIVGGGCLPDSIGADLNDIYGNQYAYCVWDHGSVNNGYSDGAEASPYRLSGLNSNSYAVIAIISPGPDKTFQTECRDYDADPMTPDGVVPAIGSDDAIFSYTYAEAASSTGEIWQIKSTDSTTAEISKNVEVKDSGGTTQASIDRATGIGVFPEITMDELYFNQNPSRIDVAGFLNFTRGDVNAAADEAYINIDTGFAQQNMEIGIYLRMDGDARTSSGRDHPFLVQTASDGNPANKSNIFWLDGAGYLFTAENFGINTHNPKARLHIRAQDTNDTRLAITGDSTTWFSLYSAFPDDDEAEGSANPSGNNRSWRQVVTPSTETAPADNDLYYSHWNGSSWLRSMTVTDNGDVGIGFEEPLERLHLNGSLLVRGRRVYMQHDGAANADNDYFFYDDSNGDIYGTGNKGMMSFHSDTTQGIGTWNNPSGGISAYGVYVDTGLAIGTTDDTETMEIDGNLRATTVVVSSDARLKEAIRPLEDTIDGIDAVKALTPVSYEWKDKDRMGEEKQLGFVAQDVAGIIPELADGTPEHQTLKYMQLIPVLVKTIQEQQDILQEQDQALNELEQAIAAQE